MIHVSYPFFSADFKNGLCFSLADQEFEKNGPKGLKIAFFKYFEVLLGLFFFEKNSYSTGKISTSVVLFVKNSMVYSTDILSSLVL